MPRRGDHLKAVAQPVFKAAAVTVRALVDGGRDELMDQVRTREQQLDTIKPALPAASPRRLEVGEDAREVPVFHLFWKRAVLRLAHPGRASRRQPRTRIPTAATA